MNKNSKQTMNKRTHDPFNRYKTNQNTNSNNQDLGEEFGAAFEESLRYSDNAPGKRNNPQSKKRK